MSTTNIPTYSDNDDDDDVNIDSATQPLLLQSTTSTSTSTAAGNGSSAAKSKLPASIVVPISKSNAAKQTPHQANGCNENRMCARFSHFINIRFSRGDHNNRRSHRDKWSRINIGLFAISFISVIYLCVSMNLNVDSKPTPQMVVDVPPVDPDLLGTKGKLQFEANKNKQFSSKRFYLIYECRIQRPKHFHLEFSILLSICSCSFIQFFYGHNQCVIFLVET